jgi:hypothetical protein
MLTRPYSHNPTKMADQMLSSIVNNEVPFPLKSIYMEEDITGIIYRLRCIYSPLVSKCGPLKTRTAFERDSPTIGTIMNQEKDYPLVFLPDILGSEEYRLRARNKSQSRSIMRKWETGDLRFLKRVLHGAHGNFDMLSMREAIFRTGEECSSFKCTAVISLFHILKSRTVLDMCAGWGDRLVGALLSPSVTDYFGTDPNRDIQPAYDNMIRVLEGDTSRYAVLDKPFEDIDLRDRLFDTIFTSPPFFDYEHYTDLPGQSIQEHSTFGGWMSGFLFPMLQKAWRHLQRGGHMCIYIQDIRQYPPICEPMVYMCETKLIDCVFKGIIWVNGSTQTGRPIWTFTKKL